MHMESTIVFPLLCNTSSVRTLFPIPSPKIYLGFCLCCLCNNIQRQFPYSFSPSLPFSELPIMSNKNQWTWMRRMCLLVQMNIKRGMPSR